MSTAVPWACSATYFSAVRAASKELGQLDLVRAKLSFETRAIVDGLHREAWWPVDRFVDYLVALEEVGGAGSGKRTGILAAHNGMGKLARPLTGALLAFSRSPLEALMSRLHTFANLGIRGVEASWTKTGAQTGRATFALPESVPTVLAEQWYGLFDLAFVLAKQGSIAKVAFEPRAHHFDLQW